MARATFYRGYIEGYRRFTRLPLFVQTGIGVAVFLIIVGISGLLYLNRAHAFSSGTGTWDDPYVISTCTELEDINNNPNLLTKDYVLSGDIDCTGVDFRPIGSAITPSANDGAAYFSFEGRFDGAGYTIRNVTVNIPSTPDLDGLGHPYGAIFVSLDDAYVHNLKLDTISISSFNGAYPGGVLAKQASHSVVAGVSFTNAAIEGSPVSFTPNDTPTASDDGGVIGGTVGYVYDPTTYTEPTSYTSVGSCAELAAAVLANPHGWYSLSNDIDCAGNMDWIPFATTTATAFNGRLEGNGHTISGIALDFTGQHFYYNDSDDSGGLFDALQGAVIQDATLAGSGLSDTNTGAGDLGALAGFGSGFVIKNVHSTVPISVAGNGAGGLVANAGGTVLDSSVVADVTPTSPAWAEGFGGGLLGWGDYAHVENSTYQGTIIGYLSLGGILGSFNQADLNNVHATTTLSGVESYGGIVGWLSGPSTLTNVSADTNVIDASPDMTTDDDYEWFGGIGGFLAGVSFDNVSASTTLTLVSQDGGEYIGGIGGELDNRYEPSYPATTTNTHATLNATFGDAGDGWQYVGGLIGWTDETVTSSSASTTMIFGVTDALATDIEDVGGLIGDSERRSLQINGDTVDSTATTTIVVNGDTSQTSMDSIGGLTGSSFNISGSHAVTYLTLTGNDIEEIGGLSGTPNDVDSSTATTTIVINGDSSETTVLGVGGFGGFPGDITNSQAHTDITINGGNDIEEVAGLAGCPGDIATSSADAAIDINGDQTETFVDDIAGLAGCPNIALNSFASSTINITANDTEEVGGLVGDDPFSPESGQYWDYASTTMNITSPMVKWVGCLFGEVDDTGGASIDQSFAQGALTISGGQDSSSQITGVGGLIGEYGGSGAISNSYSTCAVDVTSAVPDASGGAGIGSLVGILRQHHSSPSAIVNSYAVGPLTFHDGGVGSFFDNVGGLVGQSNDDSDILTDSFTASPISGALDMAGSGGALLGIYSGGETLTDDAYSSESTPNLICTGSDNPDPEWCTAHTSSNDFYSSANLPQSTWDFSSIWNENICTYPTLQYFSSLFSDICGGGAGPTPTPPTLSTAAASSITDTAATLNGSIDDIGTSAPTVRGFAYGTDTSYGATTTDSGSFSAGSFSDSLSSLTCAVTYHFRSYATSPDGTGYSSDTSFTTSACSSGGGSPPPSSSGSSGQGSSAAPAVVPAPIVSPVVPPVTPIEPPASSTSGISGQSAAPTETLPVPPAAPVETTEPPAAPTPYVTVPSITSPIFTLPSLAAVSDLALKVFDPATPSHTATVAIALVLALIGIGWTFASGAYALADIPALLIRAFNYLFGFVRNPRRKEIWGTVYDSQTKRGLDPAIVTLYDAQGNEVKQAVTDLDGRFGFDVAAGTYSLTAAKTNHIFPARNLSPVDPIYINRYEGGPIQMPQPGVLIKDVPLDPIKFDWNEEQKYHNGFMRFYSRFDRPFAYLSYLFSALGAIGAIASIFVDPSPLNYVLLVIYILVGISYLIGLGPKLYGSVRDHDSNALSKVLVRARSHGSIDLMGAHTLTDPLGRYYLLLPPGNQFEVSVEQEQADGTYKVLWSKTMQVKGGYLNRKLRV